MMYYDYCQGKSFQVCFKTLKHCVGDQSHSRAIVFRCFRQFMSEARTLEDDGRCGRMATTVTPENVSRVESLIKKGPEMTYAEMQDIMKISSRSLTRNLQDCLDVRKRRACWMPHNLSEEQKRGRVDWCTHMLRKLTRKVSSHLGHLNRRRNLGIPKRPRDEATVGDWGPSQMRTHL